MGPRTAFMAGPSNQRGHKDQGNHWDGSGYIEVVCQNLLNANVHRWSAEQFAGWMALSCQVCGNVLRLSIRT